MKQVIQNIANGSTNVVEVPCPKNKIGYLLIQSTNSLVSAGKGASSGPPTCMILVYRLSMDCFTYKYPAESLKFLYSERS